MRCSTGSSVRRLVETPLLTRAPLLAAAFLTLSAAALVALPAAALFAQPAAAQEGASAAVPEEEGVGGAWMFSIASPDGGTIDVPVTFQQNGSTVTGSIDLSVVPMVEAAEITDGVFEDGVLVFVLRVGAQGQWTSVEVEADVDGDEMSGEAYVVELEQGSTFTARRTSAPM